MLITRDFLTGGDVVVRRSKTTHQAVVVDAQSAGVGASIWLTPAGAMAVAAYALGAPEAAIEVAITQLGPDHILPELVRLITDNVQGAGQ